MFQKSSDSGGVKITRIMGIKVEVDLSLFDLGVMESVLAGAAHGKDVVILSRVLGKTLSLGLHCRRVSASYQSITTQ